MAHGARHKDAGCEVRVAGYGLRGAGCTNRLKVQGNRILFGCWLLLTGYSLLVTCYFMLVADNIKV